MNEELSHREIYRQAPARYAELVAREDDEGHLPRALQKLGVFEGADVVELGAGTGRVTRIVAPWVRSIVALDISEAMLRKAQELLVADGVTNSGLVEADHRHLPLRTGTVDVVLAGWSLCYLVSWYAQTWQEELQRGLAEIERVLRPGGSVVLIETLGTGHTTPAPPESLRPYYAYLEAAGFRMQWIRTDYRFTSPEEAETLTRFFFGSELAAGIRAHGGTTLPECTGIWWRKREPVDPNP